MGESFYNQARCIHNLVECGQCRCNFEHLSVAMLHAKKNHLLDDEELMRLETQKICGKYGLVMPGFVCSSILS